MAAGGNAGGRGAGASARFNAPEQKVNSFSAVSRLPNEANPQLRTITGKASQIGDFVVHKSLNSNDLTPTGSGYVITHKSGLMLDSGFSKQRDAIAAARVYNRDIGNLLPASGKTPTGKAGEKLRTAASKALTEVRQSYK